MIHSMSEPEAAADARLKTYPCNEDIRQRVVAALAGGLSQAELARGAGINAAIVNQYVNSAGNVYPGVIERAERKMASYLDNRETEYLGGIATVKSLITEKLEDLAKAVRRQKIIGKAVGNAGIGKTRSVNYLAMHDPSYYPYYVTKQTGTPQALQAWLFKAFGVHGGKSYGGSTTLAKHQEMVKRVRAADGVFLFDQAHALSISAMLFLCELWNETKRGQLWIGTDKLYDKVERDEQIASRAEFGDVLEMDSDNARSLIQHQIKCILPELNGELSRLTKLCERLAQPGNRFRRVEMRLNYMSYISDAPSNRGKSWCELFEQAENLRGALDQKGGDK